PATSLTRPAVRSCPPAPGCEVEEYLRKLQTVQHSCAAVSIFLIREHILHRAEAVADGGVKPLQERTVSEQHREVGSESRHHETLIVVSRSAAAGRPAGGCSPDRRR